MNWEPVREFSGRIIGWIETDSHGNQIIRAFSGLIIARYDKDLDVTREFSGRIISKGNTAVGQLYNPTINPEYRP